MTTEIAAAVADAIDAVNAALPADADDRAFLVAAKCRALIVGYHAHWHDSTYKPLIVKQLVEAQLVNPDTNKPSRSFTIAGEEDMIADYNGRRILFDHKSTSSDITDPNAPYWRQLVVESQPSHYMLLEWLNGRKCDGAVWDVMRKPNISPKKLTKAEVRAASALKTYFDREISATSAVDVVTTERETIEMYEARLIHDCVKERPEWYFQRRAIPRLDSEMLDYARDLWEIGQEMLHVRQTGRHARNSGACMLYGSPCQFLGICSGHDSPESDRWTRIGNVHRELPDLSGDGRNVVTNSRIRCFQTCRQMHHFRYELGIERIDEEEKEALYFGTAWHNALAAYWRSQLSRSVP